MEAFTIKPTTKHIRKVWAIKTTGKVKQSGKAYNRAKFKKGE